MQLMLTHGKGWEQREADPGHFVYPQLSASKRAVKILTFYKAQIILCPQPTGNLFGKEATHVPIGH